MTVLGRQLGTSPPAGSEQQIWLSAYAARSCAVKTHNQFDPTVPTVVWQPDESLQELFNGGDGFESRIIDAVVAASSLGLVDLRPLAEQPLPAQQAAAEQAVADGAAIIVGALLPVDGASGRVGSVDLLIRGEDRPDGGAGYHAGEIKWHKLHERRTLTRGERPNTSLLLADFAHPRRSDAVRKWGYGFRVSTREADLLQVAHYQRMLEAAGWAAPGAPAAALIGTDDWSPAPLVTWIDLSEPLVRTYSRSAEGGWVSRSPLQRYDHEFAFRIEVAQAARRQAEPASPAPRVSPIVIKECARCEWWEHCRSKLDPDDVSLRIGTGALDVREISTLRSHGISTVRELAVADLSDLDAWYLPEVSHRSSGAERLQAAARRARMLVEEVDFVRISEGPIALPDFATEIDFDVETSADGRVYLWGFLLNRSDGRTEYRPFSRFEDLSAETELELAHEALSWLRRTVLDDAGRVGVYHYSEFEVNHLRRLADAHPDPVFGWVDGFAHGDLDDQERRGGFVDLLPLIKDNFFGARGLGLKMVASGGAGFAWRDEDPGGLNSQRWFLDAVHGESATARRLARDRVLAYNEDDVIATARVRSWLRTQA